MIFVSTVPQPQVADSFHVQSDLSTAESVVRKHAKRKEKLATIRWAPHPPCTYIEDDIPFPRKSTTEYRRG